MSIEERLDLEREDRRHEGTLAQLGDRRKFTGCHQCGSIDGMQAVHRETLAELSAAVIALAAPWYRVAGNSEYLFYVCPECNRDKIVPGGFEPLALVYVLRWISPNATGDKRQ